MKEFDTYTPFDVLKDYSFPDTQSPVSQESIAIPKKDMPYYHFLEQHPDLQQKAVQTFHDLDDHSLRMPVIHITSRAILQDTGNEVSSGFIENMRENGFRALDTNVGAFIVRQGEPYLASPAFMASHPEKFLRELAILVERYQHHGRRTNKSVLEIQGQGIPSMVVIDSTDAALEHGSDYDNHYRLAKTLPGDAIMGTIDLESSHLLHPNGHPNEHLTTLATAFLDTIETYVHRLDVADDPQQDTL